MKKFDLITINEETLIIQNDQSIWGEDVRPVYGLITKSKDSNRIGKVIVVNVPKAKKIGNCYFSVGSTFNENLPY